MAVLSWMVLRTIHASKRHSVRNLCSAAFCPSLPSQKKKNRLFSSDSSTEGGGFFAPSNVDFESIGIRSPVLLERIQKHLGFARPSAVQASAFCAISGGGDVTVGAETGSGKTLAYLLPLLDDILQRKEKNSKYPGYDYCRAVVLVPNKELAQQVIRMATDLCGGPKCIVSQNTNNMFGQEPLPDDDDDVDDASMIRLAVMPGGLEDPQDFRPFRDSIGLGGSDPPVDLVVCTPAALAPLGVKPKHVPMFADIPTLVVDEADMLLDGGYVRPLEDVLLGFRRADKLTDATQHVFVAATLPDMGLRSVDAYLQRRFPHAARVTMAGMHNARHYGLSEQTLWIETEGNRERMARFVKLLKQRPQEGGLRGEKVMVFLNSVNDVDAANRALQRAGLKTVHYHAKLSLAEKTKNLEKFRKYGSKNKNEDDAVPVLVCTDLASRGLDVPGVTVVVQLQFAGNVVAHLHRMGRCGRAGQRNGRGIIFYGPDQRELIEVVRKAESQQERMVLEGDVPEEEEEEQESGGGGNVKAAFSRKRGFSKKRKKLRKEELTTN